MCAGAAVLNLFGGILIQKRRAEVALEQSGLNYVIVRPGGMERPTDEYKRTHNVTLAPKDTLFGGQVRSCFLLETCRITLSSHKHDLLNKQKHRRLKERSEDGEGVVTQ